MDKQSQPSSSPEDQAHQGSDAFPSVHISVEGGATGRFRITIEALDGAGEPQEARSFTVSLADGQEGFPPGGGVSVATGETRRTVLAPPKTSPTARLKAWVSEKRTALAAFTARWGLTLSLVLFGASLLVYLLTRLIGLESFPIYFFTDEAIQTVLAADLIRDSFFDYDKVLLPTFFRNVYQYNLSVSVYLQLLPYLFFGKSVFVTRAVSVLVSLLVPISAGLTLRDIFKAPYWWGGALVATIAPAWFLHSRTAFETVLATSFYALFLYLYLLYRFRSTRFLYPALVVAALGFYSYSPAQIYFALTGLLLLLSDARYHWKHRDVAARGLLLCVVLALPYVRFRFTHSEAMAEHLQMLSSYWLEDIPLQEKLSRYFKEYALGLSPGYWFIPNSEDLPRHTLKGYGHLLRGTLPFLFLGLVLALRWIRKAEYRSLLIAFLVAPTGAAIVEVGITRLLVFIVPAVLLTTLGISQTGQWLERLRLPRPLLAVSLFAVLGLISLNMTRNALENGPIWYQDYGLHSMQYGARQVFGAIKDHLKQNPEDEIVVSPSWANGTDVVARFFLPDPLPIKMGGIDGYLVEEKEIKPETLFVLPVYEFETAQTSGKFTDIQVDKVINYPNGEPGFYFTRMRYVDNIQEILAREREERARLREEMVVVDGKNTLVRYPLLDMGQIKDVFDGDSLSVARTFEANPFVLELQFPEPRELAGYSIVIGSADGELVTYAYPDLEAEPVEVRRPFEGSIEAPEIEVAFDEPLVAELLRVEVHDETQGEIGHVHVWELRLR